MHQLSAGERDELNCEKGKVLNCCNLLAVFDTAAMAKVLANKHDSKCSKVSDCSK